MAAAKTKPTPAEHQARKEAARARAMMEALEAAAAEQLEVPPAVTEIRPSRTGPGSKLTVEAINLARRVYYEQGGNMTDAAQAIFDAGLAGDLSEFTQPPVVVVGGRLQNWWRREGWPKRSYDSEMALRDVRHDGGLYRGELCKGTATGNGPAPEGTPCSHTALEDSEYCYFHDPRPEFVERREQSLAKMRKARQKQLVPLAPFQRFCERRGLELLEEARAKGEAHHNEKTGITRLCRIMELDLAQLARLVEGTHTRDGEITKIGAKTVAGFLKKAGSSFAEVYGGSPEDVYKAEQSLVCPGCGGPKDSGSEHCRSCYSAQYGPCSYVTQYGEQCRVRTKHESGICFKHREQLARPRKKRSEYDYRKGAFIQHPEILHFALDEYARTPRAEWVAKRMWACDAGGVRTHYQNRKTLTGQIVKELRKRGIGDELQALALLDELVDGDVVWPPRTEPYAPGGQLPLEAFALWLEQFVNERGDYKRLGEATGIYKDKVSQYVRREAGSPMVSRSVVERALQNKGGPSVDELLDSYYEKTS